jgi:hypothetical protein
MRPRSEKQPVGRRGQCISDETSWSVRVESLVASIFITDAHRHWSEVSCTSWVVPSALTGESAQSELAACVPRGPNMQGSSSFRAAPPRTYPRLVLAAGSFVALAMAPTASAAAAPHHDSAGVSAASEVEPTMLRVTIAPEIVDAGLIRGWIDERNRRVEDQVPSFDDHEQWIAVNVTGATYDYRVTAIAMRDGATVGVVPPPAVCACNSEKLLALIDEQIARAIEQLQEAPLEPESALVMPPPAPAASARETTESQPPPPRRRRLSRLGTAGAVLTGMGGSAVAGGVVMTVLHERDAANATQAHRSWRPPGVITLAAGGAVLVAGVSMLIVDAAQCRKSDAERRCRRSSGLAVGPSLQAGGGGVTIMGRF